MTVIQLVHVSSNDVVGVVVIALVHGHHWLLLRVTLDNPRRHPDRHTVRRQVRDHDAPGAHLAARSDDNWPQDGDPGAQQAAVSDGGVPRLPPPGAAAAERDVVQHGDVVADDGRLSYYNAGGVVEHHATPDVRPGVDVDMEDLRGSTLEGQRQGLRGVGG